jgi:hypothetical protein
MGVGRKHSRGHGASEEATGVAGFLDYGFRMFWMESHSMNSRTAAAQRTGAELIGPVLESQQVADIHRTCRL